MNITKIISKTFDSRLKQIDLYASEASEIQHRVLNRLVQQASQTEWGKKYDYSSIRSYEDFRKRLPIQTYEEIKPYVERLRAGEQNLLWPSEIRWFAKSSGTTNDKSKFLPVSKEALEDIHYRGGKDAVALYFRINPDSHFFSGKGLILGGSHSPNLNSNHSLVGDLSAILIQNVNPLVNFIRVPSKKIALMSEWETKIEAIANSTIPANVTSLSGVPSWMLVLIKRILEKTGKQTLEEVWSNLEVFFHGGTQIVLAGLTTYMVCMPLILIFGQIRGAYLGGSILAFFLGYSMMFFKGGILASIYPFSAALILVGFDMSEYAGTTTAPNPLLAVIGVGIMVLWAVLLLVMSSNKKEMKARKQTKAKGRGKRAVRRKGR